MLKRIGFHAFVAILSFIVGLTSVLLIRQKVFVLEKLVVMFVTTGEPARPRFTPMFRGCGMGYVQGYELDNGLTMTEGSDCFDSSVEAWRNFSRQLINARKIVERVPSHKDRFGDVGERVIALFPPSERSGSEYARILWYGGGECILYIEAPSVEIALEFERQNAYAF